MKVWRDDDVQVETNVDELRAVDDVLQLHSLEHTVAIIAKDVDRNRPLVEFILERGIVPELHCWTHLDLTVDGVARNDLRRGVDTIEDVFGRRPTTLYPPWNRSSAAVESAAAALGLVVSTRKVSLDQFIRCRGDVVEDVINFHYWHEKDRALLPSAARFDQRRYELMKKTDYCPRAAPFDTYLVGRDLVGVEVGVDAGAHAEAMLRHCPIALLSLVDIWDKPYPYGFCEGRLSSLGYRSRFVMIPKRSVIAAAGFEVASLDFVYIDQQSDAASAATDLTAWWPKVKAGGVLGYRNYANPTSPLARTVDAFVRDRAEELVAQVDGGEIVLVKR